MNGRAGRAQALPPQETRAPCGFCQVDPMTGMAPRLGHHFGGSLPKHLQTKPKPPPRWVSKFHAWLPASSQIQGLLLTPHTPMLSRAHGWPGHLEPVMPGRALEAATLEAKSCGEVQWLSLLEKLPSQ